MKRSLPHWKILIASMAAIAVGAGILAASLLPSGGSASAATKYRLNVGGGMAGIAVEEFLPNSATVREGDSIEFVNPYEEIHTVTYTIDEVPAFVMPAGPPPASGPPKIIVNPVVSAPTDEASTLFFDGTRYANSGILFKGQSWTVTFNEQGSFKFLCVVHPGMEASVRVVAPNAEASTQAQIDQAGSSRLTAAVRAGEASAAATELLSYRNPSGATTWEVRNPQSVGLVDVMRFVPPRLQINAGDTVLWKNDTPVPHTVTFGGTPEAIVPEVQAGGPPTLVLNPQVLFPVKPSQSYTGSGYVNSGFISSGPEATAGVNFSLTFPNAGTYVYLCILHADQGMAGVIEVGGGARPSDPPPVRLPSTGDGGLLDVDKNSVTWQSGVALAALGVLGLTGVALRLRTEK